MRLYGRLSLRTDTQTMLYLSHVELILSSCDSDFMNNNNNNDKSLFVSHMLEGVSLTLRAHDMIYFTTDLSLS